MCDLNGKCRAFPRITRFWTRPNAKVLGLASATGLQVAAPGADKPLRVPPVQRDGAQEVRKQKNRRDTLECKRWNRQNAE
jgi:hypothetical protein